MSIDTKEKKDIEKEEKDTIFVKRNKVINRNFLESLFNPVTKFDVYLFTNQLRTAISSGLEITRALSIIEDQTPKKVLKDVIRRIRFRIMQGTKISTAMSYYPWMFDKIYVASIKVGEENGQIDQILQNLEYQC